VASSVHNELVIGRTAAILLCVAAAGCASIPDGRYGVSTVDFEGVAEMDDQALAACLATHERESFVINFGRTTEPECGIPPFDGDRVTLSLWRWPWTEWPLFDRSVFERDIQRIERWYRARGYYDAEVVSASVNPPGALEPRARAEEERCTEDCEVEVAFTISEGEPVLVDEIRFVGLNLVSEDLAEDLRDAVLLESQERFDEAIYDRTKRDMATLLADESYAHARVTGVVELDPETRTADITFEFDPGPPCVFGDIEVEPIDPGPDCKLAEWTLVEDVEIPLGVIEAAALLDPGARFSNERLREAQRAIYDLAAFSSVEVTPIVPEDRTDRVIPISIRAVPGRICRFGIGAGVASGYTDQLQTETVSEPRFDYHFRLLGETRNFLGGLRRLRVEDRPRLIFQAPFPDHTEPRGGNLLRAELRQPSFIEPRTTLVFRADYDIGPDPFLDFFRHEVDFSVGPERLFFDGRLLLALRLRMNLFFPFGAEEDYRVFFLEEYAQLDLRDNAAEPTAGFYASVGAHEAGVVPVSSWNYVRLTPEVRGYVPLFFGIVFAMRFAMGMLFIFDADEGLDATTAYLGPDRFRLRGGGATSNRGYLPGDLGDSEQGGLRRWEASAELRFPITENFRFTLFADVGDVHAGRAQTDPEGGEAARFRFDHPHLALGLGFRYVTPIGPLRVDFGWAVEGAQVVGENPRPKTIVDFGFFDFPGAVHFTIGEAF
jgi:outer membrane protein assembly factor BamA